MNYPKQILVMIKYHYDETHKLSLFQSRDFSYASLIHISDEMQKLTRTTSAS